MQIAILTLLVAVAAAAPQFNFGGDFQSSSQVPLRAIILPSVPQITYRGLENQQVFPSGGQIILLQPFQQQQSQFSFVQDAPRGQLIYLQTVPQQFVNSQTVQTQTTRFQPEVPSVTPPVSQRILKPLTSTKLSPNTKPYTSITPPFQNKQKTPTFQRTSPPKPSNQVVYPSGSSGQPGQGGVNGYVTLRQSQDDNFDGNFQYNYETDHGIQVDVVGSVKNQGAEDQIQVIQGSYSYKNPDGTVITTTYTADENGFVAQGDHLPVAPPLPEAIAKSLAYIARQPSTEEKK